MMIGFEKTYDWFVNVLCFLTVLFTFQFTVPSAFASPIVFSQNNHTGILETYAYDEIENSIRVVGVSDDRANRVIPEKRVRVESEISEGVTSVAAKTGTSVLDHYPEYVKLAESIGARRFQIPTSVWNKMSAAEQWTETPSFLIG